MGIDRRNFIKGFAGFSTGISVGLTFSPVPWKLTDDIAIWTQNWSWIPSLQYGENTEARAVSKTCPSSVAVKIRKVAGRPVRVLPDEDHPLGGGVTSIAASEVQMLYSPSRVHKPLLRNEKGKLEEIAWEDAGKLLFEKLGEARRDTAFITGDENGSTAEIISAFASMLGSRQVFLMPSEAQAAAIACDIMGINGQIGYDIENSDYVLAIGADILESWGTVVSNRRAFARSRPYAGQQEGPRTVFAYAGPFCNNTATVADSWLPIKPGTETIFALGLANQLIARGNHVPASDFGQFAQLSGKFTPDVVSRLTGVPIESFRKVVDGLLSARTPLVIVGSAGNRGEGAAPILAGVAVNALLGNINRPGGLRFLAEPGVLLAGIADSRRDMYKNDLAGWFKADKKPSLLVINEANPVFAMPDPAAVKAFLKEIPFKVSFTSFMDETASECDLVLPIPMGLERIDDVVSPYGCAKSIYCLTMPVVDAQGDLRSTADTLLFMARQMGFDFGFNNYAEFLKAKSGVMRANYDILAMGTPAERDDYVSPYSVSLGSRVLSRAALPEEDDGRLSLALYSKLNLGTPTTGIPPFSVKTLRYNELDARDMYVSLNAETARRLGLPDGCRVKLGANGKSIEARLRVFEGVADGVLAVCTGYGHTAFDGFSQKKGANVMELLEATVEPETGLCVWNQTAVDVSKA